MTNTDTKEDELREKIANLLVGDYGCTRVWEAWQVGTMTEDDFVPLEETERVDEIVELFDQYATTLAERKAKEARIEELESVIKTQHRGGLNATEQRIVMRLSTLKEKNNE